MRILLLEDDPRVARSFSHRLRADGMAVDTVATLEETRLAVDDVDYDCLVLDRFVPDGDSLDLVADLDQRESHAPVVVVSAIGESDQRVVGLAAGADDYLPKPVKLDELALRVRRVAVRHSADPARGPIRMGRVTLDQRRKHVTLDGEAVHLTSHGYAVFERLAINRDRMVQTDELLEHCWDAGRDLFSSPIHSQITRLRKLFRGALRIESIHRAGYVLVVLDTGTDPGAAST